MTIQSVNNDVIAKAAEILKSGGCVAIPTETVYGLAGDATNADAVAKIFDIKGRPSFNPLISHFADVKHVMEYVDLTTHAKALASAFWPGPLTMIAKRRRTCVISDKTCAGLDTIAVRVPAHPTAQKIIRAAGVPLAAPSANKSGEISPTSAIHVAHSLGDKAPLIIADGVSSVGLESTVVDMSGDKPVILRPGAITADQISDVLGCQIGVDLGSHDTPKSPGQLLKHYAPNKPIRLKAFDLKDNEALLAFGSTKFMPVSKTHQNHLLNLSEIGDLYEAAGNLFDYMRRLDQTDATSIAVMDIPKIGIGLAINDRLQRAAEG